MAVTSINWVVPPDADDDTLITALPAQGGISWVNAFGWSTPPGVRTVSGDVKFIGRTTANQFSQVRTSDLITNPDQKITVTLRSIANTSGQTDVRFRESAAAFTFYRVRFHTNGDLVVYRHVASVDGTAIYTGSWVRPADGIDFDAIITHVNTETDAEAPCVRITIETNVAGQSPIVVEDTNGARIQGTGYIALYLNASPFFGYGLRALEAEEVSFATAYSVTGPTTGPSGVESDPFTVTPNGPVEGTVTVTPSDGNGGTFDPATVDLSGDDTPTFTYTPSSAGVKTITFTNDGGLTDPAPLEYTATGGPTPPAPRGFAGMALGLGLGLGFGVQGGGGAPTPPVWSPSYDQGMGETDQYGLVKEFPLLENGNARMFFVDPVNGNDSYNGLSPYAGYRGNGTGSYYQYGATGQGSSDGNYGPKATLMAGFNAVPETATDGAPNGQPHQLFVCSGESYTATAPASNGWDSRSGLSVAYPFCIQSYERDDPWNKGKHGRAGIHGNGARPFVSVNPTGTTIFGTYRGQGPYGRFALRGLHLWTAQSETEGRAVNQIGSQIDILTENCRFENVSIVQDFTTTNFPDDYIGTNIIVRRCVIDLQWGSASGNGPSGTHNYATDATYEYNIFYHNGWKEGALRSASNNDGGSNGRKHSLYLSNVRGSTSIVRYNVLIAAGYGGVSARGNVESYNNVAIDCPQAFIGGGQVADWSTENPDGIVSKQHDNLVMGLETGNGGSMTSQGMQAGNAVAPSFAARNLFINGGPQKANLQAAIWIKSEYPLGGPYAPCEVDVFENWLFDYCDTIHLVQPGYDNLTINDLGGNSNSPTSPISTPDIYAHFGADDRDELVDLMRADPLRNWAYEMEKYVSAACGKEFEYA